MDTITQLKLKAFFVFRNWNCRWPKFQQEIIRIWEPEVQKTLSGMTHEDYQEFRKFLNIKGMYEGGLVKARRISRIINGIYEIDR